MLHRYVFSAWHTVERRTKQTLTLTTHRQLDNWLRFNKQLSTMTFWPYRDQQYSLGKDNGLQGAGTKMYYAAVSVFVCLLD